MLPSVFARVVDVHPTGNTIDCLGMTDGRRFVAVPVIGMHSTNTGLIDLPMPDMVDANGSALSRGSAGWEEKKWNSRLTRTRDVIALISFVEETPICIGFVPPQLCETHLTDALGLNRKLERHNSDVYSWIDEKGDSQWAHPGGSFMSVGESVAFKDLTKADFDKKWNIKRNTSRMINFLGRLIAAGKRVVEASASYLGVVSLSSIKKIMFIVDNDIANITGGDKGTAHVRLEVEGKIDSYADATIKETAGASDQVVSLMKAEDGSYKLTATETITLQVGGNKIEIKQNGRITVTADVLADFAAPIVRVRKLIIQEGMAIAGMIEPLDAALSIAGDTKVTGRVTATGFDVGS